MDLKLGRMVTHDDIWWHDHKHVKQGTLPGVPSLLARPASWSPFMAVPNFNQYMCSQIFARLHFMMVWPQKFICDLAIMLFIFNVTLKWPWILDHSGHDLEMNFRISFMWSWDNLGMTSTMPQLPPHPQSTPHTAKVCSLTIKEDWSS